MGNSKQAVKLLNLLKAYPSGCVAWILFAVFLSFPPTAFVPITNVKHEASDCGVKCGYEPTPEQHSGSARHCFIVCCCCHITIVLPPWLTGILSLCPLFLSLPPSFSFPTQSELFVKTPPQDEWTDTQRRIQLPANTIALITGVKNANRWEAHAKMFSCQMWGRQNKMWDRIIWMGISPSAGCLTPWPLLHAVTEGPSCIFKFYMGGQVFDKGEPWPLNPWPWFKPGPGCDRLADRHKVKSAFQNKTRPVLQSLCQHEDPCALGCVTDRCTFSCTGTTSTQRGSLMHTRTPNLISSHLVLRGPLFHTKPHRACTFDGAGIVSNTPER